MLRVFIVDDEHLVNEAFVALLKCTGEVEVVGTVSSGEAALEMIDQANEADIVLMDIELGHGRMNGIQTLVELGGHGCTAPVLMLTGKPFASTIKLAMQTGARGYVLKGAHVEELLTAMRTVAAGGEYVSDGAKESLLAHAMGRRPYGDRPPLTKREIQVLKLVVAGHTTGEIGKLLFISVNTAETHRRNLLRKLECKNTAQLVSYAKEHGLADE